VRYRDDEGAEDAAVLQAIRSQSHTGAPPPVATGPARPLPGRRPRSRAGAAGKGARA
jgi:hypothetical protein